MTKQEIYLADAGSNKEIEITPGMLEAGIRAFRRWEERFMWQDDAYPFSDSELEQAVTMVFLGMLGKGGRRDA